jgi:hypothetical protein
MLLRTHIKKIAKLLFMHKNLYILSLIGFVTTSFAQSGVGISPPRVELQASNGTQLTQEVQVDNPSGGASLEVTVTLQDALFQPDGSLFYLPPGSHPNSLMNWMSVNQLQFVLSPLSSEAVGYTIQVPPEVPEGTYWGVMFFESGVPGEEGAVEGIGIRTRVRVGHIVYVDVGQVTREGHIEGVRYQGRDGDIPPSIQVMFRNTGNGLTRLNGHVELRNLDGELLQTIELSDQAVFPGYARELSAPLLAPLESGNYVALAVMDYGAGSLIAGEGQISVP